MNPRQLRDEREATARIVSDEGTRRRGEAVKTTQNAAGNPKGVAASSATGARGKKDRGADRRARVDHDGLSATMTR